MYRTSSDRRFYKIKKDIRTAFVKLVLDKDHFTDISITEVSDLADINRKTFYLHYDGLDDILTEYADDLSEDLMQYLYKASSFSVENIFEWMDLHSDEHPFVRKLSTQDKLLVFDGKCRNTLYDYFQSCMFTGKNMSPVEIRTVCSYLSAGLTDVMRQWTLIGQKEDREAVIRQTREIMEKGLSGLEKKPAIGVPDRSYEADARMEHFNTMQNYLSLARDPVSPKNVKQITEIQNRRIRELMEAAWNIPFYHERFLQSGTRPSDYKKADDLYRFPVLTKEELRSWTRAELESSPDKFRSWHSYATSGSTGDPLELVFSPNENAWLTANWLRVLAMPGYNPFTGKTMSRTLLPRENARDLDSLVQRFGILRRRSMSDTVDPAALAEEINRYRPDYLYNYMDILLAIARYAKETGTAIWHPQYFAPTGFQVDSEARELLTDVFGGGLVDTYGLIETGACVIKLPGKKYYQINSDTHVVNTYTADLTGPSLSGQAVITPLFKTEMPIINYISGDGMESYIKQGIRFIRTIDSRAFS